MSIKDTDVKKLWGLSAGRCSRPGCDELCIRFLTDDPTVIGEMAHIIAKSPDGPRGVSDGGSDTYQNLILLCPTHHTEIDKAAPGTFSADVLLDWKKQHEAEVNDGFSSPVYSSSAEMATFVKRLLIENETAWRTYGPDSPTAQSNPLSNLHLLWPLRKLDTIVPNNRRIVNIIQRNSTLFDVPGYAAACLFVEHAEGFEGESAEYCPKRSGTSA
ncbi:MAG TPA: HNH endonuclease signature motif containing protein [Terriglobales bacterium]|jgi:hypothetical protein